MTYNFDLSNKIIHIQVLYNTTLFLESKLKKLKKIKSKVKACSWLLAFPTDYELSLPLHKTQAAPPFSPLWAQRCGWSK